MPTTISTKIKIKANAKLIWKELINFAQYPLWNPLITKATGEIDVGKQLNITIKAKNGSETLFTPTILKNDEFKELRWKGNLYFDLFLTGEHYFKLIEESKDECELEHGEIFDGYSSALIVWFSGKDFAHQFEAMNTRLKSRVESLWSADNAANATSRDLSTGPMDAAHKARHVDQVSNHSISNISHFKIQKDVNDNLNDNEKISLINH